MNNVGYYIEFCDDGIDFLGENEFNYEKAYENCTRGDWLIYLIDRIINFALQNMHTNEYNEEDLQCLSYLYEIYTIIVNSTIFTKVQYAYKEDDESMAFCDANFLKDGFYNSQMFPHNEEQTKLINELAIYIKKHVTYKTLSNIATRLLRYDN